MNSYRLSVVGRRSSVVSLSGPTIRSGEPKRAGSGLARWGLALLLLCLLAIPGQAAAQLPVAARDLPRGAVLAAGDIAFVAAEGADTASGDGRRVGWITRRVITAGEPLRQPAVGPPELVRSGQTVDVTWKQGSIEVRARGQATRSGAMGDRVTVRVGPRRRLEGVVAGPALIRLNSSDRGK